MGTGLSSLLIANRGEIAIRIARAAAEHGLRTVAVHSEDDAAALHTRKSDETRALRGSGPAAYLDAEQIVAVARAAGCDAIHPGYGFLSESSAFARRCAAEGLVFVGPSPEALDVFGDKARTRALAQRVGVPVLAGTTGPTSLDEARVFLAEQGAGPGIMLKAIAGGGGRGMRLVQDADDLEAAYARCRSEALQSFGNGDVYAERLFPRARHIEVQVAGDRSGSVTHLWERECSIQRQRQKLIEIAPAPGLGMRVRERILEAAMSLARAAGLDNLATVEFLVDADGGEDAAFAFIEANARLIVSVGHLISWSGFCPRLDESAGKRRSTRTRQSTPWLKPTLVNAAWAATHKKAGYLRAQFLRIKTRRGAKKAILAVASTRQLRRIERT